PAAFRPRSRSDAARTRRRARFREMHVHNAPVARFLAEHHRRARDERNAVAPRLWRRVRAVPFRPRMPFAPDAGDIVRYDTAEVEWRPIAAPDVRLIELPQPGPVL